MAKITKVALASCLALASYHADAFTVPRTCVPRSENRELSKSKPSSISSTAVLFPSLRRFPIQLSSTAIDSEQGSSTSLNRLPDSAVELTLRIPGAATKGAYDKTLASVAKSVSIPGFRKGAKIPAQVIENAWAANGGKRALRAQAINELCGELIAPALKDEYELEPIGQPALVTSAETLAEQFTPGEPLEVVVKCDVWPDIKWMEVEGKEKPYLGLKGKYKRKPFNQERFDAALKDLTERFARLEPYTDKDQQLAMGDACVVNMEGYMATADGEKGDPLPDAASGDNVEVILGQGRYMEGLVEGLEGGKVGETKTVKVRFPQALRNKDLAGKDAIFDVEIISASKRVLPEVTDEFANQVRPGLTVESLEAELRKAVDSQDAQEYMGARNEALGAALSEIMDVEVPDTLVTNQAREKYALMMTDMRDNGMADEEIKKLISPENFVKYKDLSKDGIVRDFKVSMAVDEIARLENIQVPAYQVEEQIQSLKDQAAKEGQTEEIDDEQMRRKVESTLERRMVYDFLAEHAELEVEYVDQEQFDEGLMERLAAESLQREQNEGALGKDDTVVAASKPEESKQEEKSKAIPAKAESVETSATSSSEIDASKYENMDLEERAFSILTDLGMVDINPDPDSPDFDSSAFTEEDDE